MGWKKFQFAGTTRMAIKNTIKTEIVYLSSLQSFAQFLTIQLANYTYSTTKDSNTRKGVLIFYSGRKVEIKKW